MTDFRRRWCCMLWNDHSWTHDFSSHFKAVPHGQGSIWGTPYWQQNASPRVQALAFSI